MVFEPFGERAHVDLLVYSKLFIFFRKAEKRDPLFKKAFLWCNATSVLSKSTFSFSRFFPPFLPKPCRRNTYEKQVTTLAAHRFYFVSVDSRILRRESTWRLREPGNGRGNHLL